MYILLMISCISGMCLNEDIFSRGITYTWPAILGGSTVTFICPNNPAYSVSRECSAIGRWHDFDREACGVLTEELNNLLMTQVRDHSTHITTQAIIVMVESIR